MFEFRLDDGDGTYEPVGDDAPVLAEVSATYGFAVFTPTETGDYWVTESTAPPGLDTADPILVHYTASSENCGLAGSVLRCEPDDDQSGGFLIVVVADSPTGGVGPEVTAPPTDTVTGDVSRICRHRAGSDPGLARRSGRPRRSKIRPVSVTSRRRGDPALTAAHSP